MKRASSFGFGDVVGAAFVIRERNEIRFDIFYSSLSEKRARERP